MPLFLDQMVRFPQQVISVVAGSPNAGKTAFMVETLRMNLRGDLPIVYLTCEAPSELMIRLRSYFSEEEIKLCKEKARIFEIKSGQYADQIERLNPDGITIIDYVEEPQGEPWRLPRQFRDINNALRKGIAICSLQKNPLNPTGKGGYGTEEAARLYITMDNLLELDRRGSHVSELRIKKLKLPSDGGNHTEKVLHVEINYGTEIAPLTTWFRHEGKPEKFREAMKGQYLDNVRKGLPLATEPPTYGEKVLCRVPTKDGKEEFLRQKTLTGWQTSFPNINVQKEFDDWLFDWIKKNDNWQPNGKWVHQIRGMLKKKNEAASGSTKTDIPWE
jgi:hypothetical protein